VGRQLGQRGRFQMFRVLNGRDEFFGTLPANMTALKLDRW
jgi:hypothetical protein